MKLKRNKIGNCYYHSKVQEFKLKNIMSMSMSMNTRKALYKTTLSISIDAWYYLELRAWLRGATTSYSKVQILLTQV